MRLDPLISEVRAYRAPVVEKISLKLGGGTSSTSILKLLRRVNSEELFCTFRVPHYNQGSYQNLTVVRMEGRNPQVLCVCVCQAFAYASVTNVRFLVGTLIGMRNPECTEQFFQYGD